MSGAVIGRVRLNFVQLCVPGHLEILEDTTRFFQAFTKFDLFNLWPKI
jgi:hypothetical protein